MKLKFVSKEDIVIAMFVIENDEVRRVAFHEDYITESPTEVGDIETIDAYPSLEAGGKSLDQVFDEFLTDKMGSRLKEVDPRLVETIGVVFAKE